MKLNNNHRSMIASAFVAAYDHATGVDENKRRSLCCSPDSPVACARIVGPRAAGKLQSFFHEELGCCGWKDTEYQELQEQYFLDKISVLETL